MNGSQINNVQSLPSESRVDYTSSIPIHNPAGERQTGLHCRSHSYAQLTRVSHNLRWAYHEPNALFASLQSLSVRSPLGIIVPDCTERCRSVEVGLWPDDRGERVTNRYRVFLFFFL